MNRPLPARRSIRLQGYDYSGEGLYFVTICVQDMKCLFGKVVDGEMLLNEAGKIINETWFDLPNHNPYIELDAWCIMPNHVHGIIIINNTPVGVDSKSTRNNIEQAGLEPAPTKHPLSEIIRQFKTFSAKRINQVNNTVGKKLWQRNYYEHIIRNSTSYTNIAEYILSNPANWMTDKYYSITDNCSLITAN